MELDLNSLLREIHSWKNDVKKKDEEIEMLFSQNKELKLCIEALDSSNKKLLQEIAYFNDIVSNLQSQLSKDEKYEAENKLLNEEINCLKLSLSDQEKIHQKKINDLGKSIEKQKHIHKKELEEKFAEASIEATTKLQKISSSLKEKENVIIQLKKEIENIKNERSQDILRIKIEYEEKLCRIKSKLAKNKGSHHHHQDSKSNDIFRQKYVEKEREAKEESLRLKRDIEELKKELDNLKSVKSHTSLQQSSSLSNCLVFADNESSFFEEVNPSKKLKLNSPADDDFVHSHLININKSAKVNFSSKKKLFNVDMNYFDK